MTEQEVTDNFHIGITELAEQKVLRGLDPDNPRPLALLYQTGYLSIKDYNREYGYYTLGIPNREVSDGFFTFLLPYYAN